MAEGGNIIRIIGGKSEWIAEEEFNIIATKGDVVFSSPKRVNLEGIEGGREIGVYDWESNYLEEGWWNCDYEGNEKITKAKIGETVYFQIRMTKKFPKKTLPTDKQKTISFKLYEFDGNEYSIGLIYIVGPPLIGMKKKPKKGSEISYVTWEDINKNNELDPEEYYTKKPYTEVKAIGNKAVITFKLSKGLMDYFNKIALLKLFMSVTYAGETLLLPENEKDYLDVELYCCSEECRKPWDDLVKFDPRNVPAVSKYIKNKYDYNSDFRSPKRRWKILPISEAFGNNLNMDYYSVKITKLPIIKNSSWSPNTLFEFVRKNLNSFLNKDIASFSADSERDENVWNSNNPLTTVMKFHVILPINKNIFDDAAVICTSFVPSQSWIFSPIQNPNNGQHPVSGNRQFGLRPIGEDYEFYIRGADRLTGFLDTLAEKEAFAGADALWKGFQNSLINFIKKHGGEAEVDESKYVWKRCKWIEK